VAENPNILRCGVGWWRQWLTVVAGGDAMASVAAGFKIGVHDFP